MGALVIPGVVTRNGTEAVHDRVAGRCYEGEFDANVVVMVV